MEIASCDIATLQTTKGRCFLRLVAASGTVAAAPALLYK
jgi:hypothetical protein